MDSYDNGGWLPPGITLVTNYPDVESSLAAGHAYIQRRYGPERLIGLPDLGPPTETWALPVDEGQAHPTAALHTSQG